MNRWRERRRDGGVEPDEVKYLILGLAFLALAVVVLAVLLTGGPHG